MWLHNKSIIMIQDKMHKNGQIVTINHKQYRIMDSGREYDVCIKCDLDFTDDCLDRQMNINCLKVIPFYSILKQVHHDTK